MSHPAQVISTAFHSTQVANAVIANKASSLGWRAQVQMPGWLYLKLNLSVCLCIY